MFFKFPVSLLWLCWWSIESIRSLDVGLRDACSLELALELFRTWPSSDSDASLVKRKLDETYQLFSEDCHEQMMLIDVDWCWLISLCLMLILIGLGVDATLAPCNAPVETKLSNPCFKTRVVVITPVSKFQIHKSHFAQMFCVCSKGVVSVVAGIEIWLHIIFDYVDLKTINICFTLYHCICWNYSTLLPAFLYCFILIYANLFYSFYRNL